jgi:hypothetical protein
MKTNTQLPHEQKLTIVFRVEPGCLGPEGAGHVADFCLAAQKDIAAIDASFIHWELTPRDDKTLAEMQYKLGNKTLTPVQAKKYLALFHRDIDELEMRLNEMLTHCIDQYLGHN